MTETATQLLAKFETLSASEQHELLVEMLRRSRELPEDFFSDEHLVQVADELFQQLDCEEAEVKAPVPQRGEVWLVDLGMVAKVRPCLVLSIPANKDNDRILTTLIPHATIVSDSRFEVPLEVRFLKSGVFDAQNLVTIPTVRARFSGDRSRQTRRE